MFGRLDSTMFLIHLAEERAFSVERSVLSWTGELTLLQQKASQQLLVAVRKKQTTLVEAVTGAGKTEILFGTLADAIEQGQRIAVLSPRVDVLNELLPRLQAAFARVKICLMHGLVEQSYYYSQFVLATTHQIIKFKAAFDLIVVDEADAFPLSNNRELWQGIFRAKHPEGTCVFLTATPNRYLRKITETTISLLSRYHGYPLVNLEFYRTANWRKQLPTKLVRYLEDFHQVTQKVLIFVPEIDDIFDVVSKVQAIYSGRVTGVFAADPERLTKIEDFRTNKLRILVTTIILERGVSFSNLDVMILGADEAVFTQASLLQIVGRVGRDVHYPSGRAWAFAGERSWAFLFACQEIKRVNRYGQTKL